MIAEDAPRMRVLHLYPFVPGGRHGGTLRLRAALAGTERVGEPELHFFDPDRSAWQGPAELDLDPPSTHAPPSGTGLKRRLFPSTLWESGRAARQAARGYVERLGPDSEATVVLHTTYLAPLLAGLPVAPRRALVDAYDLVWRAHANDALSGAPGQRAVRSAYAATVRPRELRALRRADGILVAGREDWELLRGEASAVDWVPTPTPVEAVEPRAADPGRLRLGLLGNFAHQSTRAGAELLVGSKLGADPAVEIVLAGLQSEALVGSARVTIRGAVDRVESFYAEVDCVVAPVLGGSGMKVKLAEAVLAGRPVLTTPLGATGYPDSLSRFFALAEPDAFDAAAALRAIAEFDRDAARAAFERELGWDRVLDLYASAAGRGRGRVAATAGEVSPPRQVGSSITVRINEQGA